MKYIIALFAIVSFASCKKEYTCSCTSPAGFNQTYTYKETKKNSNEALKRCEGWTSYYQTNRQDNTTCKLQ